MAQTESNTTDAIQEERSTSEMKCESAQQQRPSHPAIKYDWYQTESHVIITVLAKNVRNDKVMMQYGDQTLDAAIEISPEFTYRLHLDLAKPIVPDQCSYKILSSKVEAKLKKRDGDRWSALEGKPVEKSTSTCSRNWDRLCDNELKDDGADTELNKLFQKIYSEGSDEVKKAMNKSFVESGGTVLSTNWKEVGRDKVEIQPPDGMEWKRWES